MDGKVDFIGSVGHDEVIKWMYHSVALIQHSVQAFDGDSEGTPNGILEAGAAGLPVIATRHAGIKDVVIENETGFLVDEGDVDGMAKNMIRVLKNPEESFRMGTIAREHISKNYSLEKSMMGLQDILTKACQSR